MQTMRQDAETILQSAIQAVLPDEAVRRALSGRVFPGKVYLVAAGKAAYRMAAAAAEMVPGLAEGVVITKYGHLGPPIGNLRMLEAGHPTPDENSFLAAEEALRLADRAGEGDTVLFLLSGGGSALFESPLIPGTELQDITGQLLGCGADIVEINTIRKRLSAVKGGRFALRCAPARVFSVVLSDIIGDPLDMIASGPAVPDRSTSADARRVAEKYHLRLSGEARRLLDIETPKRVDNVTTVLSGSVRELVAAAGRAAESLGYTPVFLTDRLNCEAREAGRFLASILKSHEDTRRNLAFLAGGETVVHLTGSGKGGRNQELALAAAPGIAGMENAALFSAGSDGTDGPTDAAGGYADGDTEGKLRELGITVDAVLAENDAYHALLKAGGLLVTGPTGTNVNDLTVGLLRKTGQ